MVPGAAAAPRWLRRLLPVTAAPQRCGCCCPLRRLLLLHGPCGPCGRCCRLPIGRTANFFDIDIVADVRAEQACWQLPLNEGSMHFGRMQGGDSSHDSSTQAFFNVKNVPEVFSHFDEFSWELSKLDLKHFRQNAMRNDIMAAART